MKILYITTLLSHHELPLVRHISSILGEDNVMYVALQQDKASSITGGGYESADFQWINTLRDDTDVVKYMHWWEEADLVITNEKAWMLMKRRLKYNQPTVYASERWWKPALGAVRILHPPFVNKSSGIYSVSKYSHMYYFGIGKYAIRDLAVVPALRNKTWLWGYFPEITTSVGLTTSHEDIQILWVGRLLSWKRTDILIRALYILQKDYSHVHLTIVGDGPYKAKIEKTMRRLTGIKSLVSMISKVEYDVVRLMMHNSDIMVVSSSGYEGWGAVVNEAMSEGCAVVASKQAGAAYTIIEDNVNGMLFNSGDEMELYHKLRVLCENRNLMNSISQKGQACINNLWSPRVAAERLVGFTYAVLSGRQPHGYDDGPLSKCQVSRQ